MILLSLIFIGIFLANEGIYWILFTKIRKTDTLFWKRYTLFYLIIWIFFLISPVIISSSLLTDISYFFELWIWFLLVGILFCAVGIKLLRDTLKMNKIRGLIKGWHNFVSGGPYKIARHPYYTSWFLIYLGLVFVFDSLIGLFFMPIFLLLLSLESYLEEKYILLPKLGKKYKKYMKDVPSKLIPPPYNGFLMIVIALVIFIGIRNSGLILSSL